MKLQYLGDSRDAFKWDLLHWLCTRAEPPFAQLLIIPLLTPDDAVRRDGQTSHTWFPCRPLIRPFVAGLGAAPRSLDRTAALGALEPGHPFDVNVVQTAAFVEERNRRRSYWDWCEPERYTNTLVFLDPDNGFETRTQHGPKWVRHAEVKWLLEGLPDSSAVAVYQHRPRRRWDELFADLAAQLDYAPHAQAVHEASLAFLLLAKAYGTRERLSGSVGRYCESRPGVAAQVLRSNGAEAERRAGARGGRARRHSRERSHRETVMATCACGCDKRTAGGAFAPGHDQKLRAAVEARVGGLLSVVRLVDAVEKFAAGKLDSEELRAAIPASLRR